MTGKTVRNPGPSVDPDTGCRVDPRDSGGRVGPLSVKGPVTGTNSFFLGLKGKTWTPHPSHLTSPTPPGKTKIQILYS